VIISRIFLEFHLVSGSGSFVSYLIVYVFIYKKAQSTARQTIQKCQMSTVVDFQLYLLLNKTLI
jgi:hypothetical protein